MHGALVIGLLAATAGGCGSAAPSPQRTIDANIANLGWDLSGVRDDLLVARVDAAGQRSRLRLTFDDLRLVRRSPADRLCDATADVTSDARDARDGVVAVRNDTARAERSLQIVDVDLTSLERQSKAPRLPRRSARLATEARARALLVSSRYRAEIASLTKEAEQLQKRITDLAHRAVALCARVRRA